jgi:retron-type reverse transcriptase
VNRKTPARRTLGRRDRFRMGRVQSILPHSTVLEADISGYFDAIVRSLLMEMVEKRVSDGTILRLIGKWINIGVMGPRAGC